MKSIILLSVTTIFAALPALATAPTPPDTETTFGSCSPNMSHNSGSVTINCKGLDPAVADEISEVVKQISLLNKKTATEKNQQLMIKILKDMKSSLASAIAQPTFQVNGPITQNSAGNCSPNIVGNNNTNVCGPQDLKMNTEQASEFTRIMSSVVTTVPRGKINILVEVQNHQTQVVGDALGVALRNAGFDVGLTHSYIVGDSQNNYGGITFNEVSEPSLPVARAIATVLNQLGVVRGPIPTFSLAPPSVPTPNFTIYVRRPQE